MDYNDREIVVEDFVSRPLLVFLLSGITLSIGLLMNVHIAGDIGDYTVLGLIPIMLGMIGMLAANTSLQPTHREYLATAMVVAIIPLALLVSYTSGWANAVSQSLLGACLLATVLSIAISSHDWFVTWYFDEESPEERVLDE